MRAADAISNYLKEVKENVEHQVGEDDKHIIFTNIDFVRWLIDELGGDLNVDIDLDQMFEIFIGEQE